MDTTEVNESFATPKRQPDSQFRQMISQQVGQLLFNSPLSVCCGQIQNDTIVEENKEHDVTKRVNRKHRRHHSMHENKRQHCRASYSPSEHATGTCQPGTRKTSYSKNHTNEEIHEKDTVCSDDSSLSRVNPHNDTICMNLGERTPCDGQESSPVQQRRQRASSVQSRCTVPKVNRSIPMKEGRRTKKLKQLYLESDVTVSDDKNVVIQCQRPMVPEKCCKLD